ncbi:ATP-grasp domain-containing protein [Scopulibacillus cellulosilyticus]|uniref:Acetyl-CoA carboxylase biotin carboxylase subunit family protein n=1 Tax=Scopulibacillus cellulosilyticus TaxID=2665665 RepID=A0ABW2Q373_9BACL
MDQPVFIQIGATRDGLDPYLQAARKNNLFTVLIETPDYIRFRETMGYPEFDYTIALSHPTNSNDVLQELKQFGDNIKLVLAGFERYTLTSYHVAKYLNLPYAISETFMPLNKFEQHELLKNTTTIRQPMFLIKSVNHSSLMLDKLTYPLVVKPVDGGGGLGVFYVQSAQEAKIAIEEISKLTNYDGEHFQGIIFEEFIPGQEYSVQGMVYDGNIQILTCCTKLSRLEKYDRNSYIHGFREIGHIAQSGISVDGDVYKFVSEVIKGFKYKNGPFHIDFIQNSDQFYFIEAGFRLSGGRVVSLVQTVTGLNWGHLVVDLYLGDLKIKNTLSNGVYGQMNAMAEDEILRAKELQEQGYPVKIARLPNRPLEAESQLKHAKTLMADRIRHKTPLAQIKSYSTSVTKVMSLLIQCVPDVLQNKLIKEEV